MQGLYLKNSNSECLLNFVRKNIDINTSNNTVLNNLYTIPLQQLCTYNKYNALNYQKQKILLNKLRITIPKLEV